MKKLFRLLAVSALCGVMFTACDPTEEQQTPGGDNIDDATSLSGAISENKTLPDLGLDVDYIVDGTLSIDGNALLTIEPGVTIMFTGTNGAVEVGENAGLKMVGTAEKPIKFVGPANNPNNGSWSHITYNSTRSDNQMEYVYMLRGGSDDATWAGVLRNYGRISMKNCTIDGSLCNGIDIEGGLFTSFEGNTIKNCAAYPIYNESGLQCIRNFGANTYTSNGKNYIRMASGATLSEDLTIVNEGIPYFFEGDCGVTGPYTLTIEAGTQLLFNIGGRFYTDEEPAIVAHGTAENPIIFRGMRNEPGYWNGVWPETTRYDNSMAYCKIYDAGREEGWQGGCLYIGRNTRLNLLGCEFGNSGHYGVVIEDDADFNHNIVHNGTCTFVNCADGNVYFEQTGETADNLPL